MVTQSCAGWPPNGYSRHFRRQPLSLALHCCVQRSLCRQVYTGRESVSKELLPTKKSSHQRTDFVRPELRTKFEATKKEWLAWDEWSRQTLGLFKLECEGSRMIAFCSKCYYVVEQDSEKKKFSTKGMSKHQNFITWQHFKAALEGCTDRAKN